MQTNQRKRDINRSGFINGVLILSVSTFICKVIGLFFKIPIIDIVGIDGMAYFSAAYNIYMLLNSISVAGLPVAMSILISKNDAVGNTANIKKVYNISLAIFLILGISGTLLLIFGADYYSELIGIEGAASAVRAIAPTLLFICISGAVRGYFQGHEIMLPTAISQLIESAGKLILGVGFATLAVRSKLGDELTAASAVFGLSVGVFISTIYLAISRAFFKRGRSNKDSCSAQNPDKSGKLLYRLCIIALPITLASCITSLTSLADTALITNRLIIAGFSKDAAVTLYSSYTNLAIPLFNLPPALITAVAVSLIPSLTSAITKNKAETSEEIFSSSVRLCIGFSIPAAAGMAIFAHPILDMIYSTESEACSFAAPLLSILSVAIVFSCLTTVFNAVLQAYLKPILPIISMGAGAVVKILAEYLLVGSDIGIYGAPISTLACTFTILLLNAVFVMIYTPHRIKYCDIIRTFGATVVSVGASAAFYITMLKTSISSNISLLSAIFVAVVFYALFALVFGVIRYGDIVRIPFGNKIANTLKRMKLIKE